MMDWLYDVFTVDTVKTILTCVEYFFIVYLIGYSTFLFVSVLVGENQLFEDMRKNS